MIIIPPKGPTSLSKEAIILSDDELEAVIHALYDGRDRATQAGTKHYNTRGRHYGKMTIDELDVFMAQLRVYQKEKGA